LLQYKSATQQKLNSSTKAGNINMKIQNIATLGELKASGYKPKSIKEEIRDNLIVRLKKGEETFPGIIGYEETVTLM
jgi:hypothetical protein